jgi:hypothetical protein
LRLLLVLILCSSCIRFPSYRSLIEPGATGRIVFRDAAVFTGTSTEMLQHQERTSTLRREMSGLVQPRVE